MMEQTVNDTITNAVIAVLANDEYIDGECKRVARETEPQGLEYETDREAGLQICSLYGEEVCGQLTGYVNWALVGQHFREGSTDE